MDELFRTDEFPPIGVIPLGTGNDLARSLEWGGGYSGEPASSLLTEFRQANIQVWQLAGIFAILSSPPPLPLLLLSFSPPSPPPKPLFWLFV